MSYVVDLANIVTEAIAPYGTERHSPEWVFWQRAATKAISAISRSQTHEIRARRCSQTQYFVFDDELKELRPLGRR